MNSNVVYFVKIAHLFIIHFQHMRSIFKQHGRPDVPWVCVTITDGISKNGVATAKEAELAEQMGINMFAVGIGHRIDMSELRAIASTERQTITLDNFNQLGAMLPAMMTTICRKLTICYSFHDHCSL